MEHNYDIQSIFWVYHENFAEKKRGIVDSSKYGWYSAIIMKTCIWFLVLLLMSSGAEKGYYCYSRQ